jgi:hypothetical protein
MPLSSLAVNQPLCQKFVYLFSTSMVYLRGHFAKKFNFSLFLCNFANRSAKQQDLLVKYRCTFDWLKLVLRDVIYHAEDRRGCHIAPIKALKFSLDKSI